MPRWCRTLFTVWFTRFIAVAALMFGAGALAVVLWIREGNRNRT